MSYHKRYFISLILLAFGLGACFPSVSPPPVTPPSPLDLQPVLPPTPTSATYVVAKNGNDNNDGSEENPFATLEKAINSANAGDTVYIRAGTYQEDKLELRRSGTAGARITFMAYPNESVTLDWSDKSNGGMVFDGADYIVLRDMTLKNSPQQCLLLGDNANHNVFVNMRFESCFGSGFQIYRGSNNIVAYSYAKNNIDNSSNADGFGSVGQGGDSNANEFWYSVAEANGDDGFDTWKGTNSIVHGNIAFANGRNGGDGNGFKLGGEGNNAAGIIRRNIAYENSNNGFDTNTGGGNKIYNNTAWRNKRNFVSTRASNLNTFRNNLSFEGELGMFNSFDDKFNSWTLNITNPNFASTDPSNPNFLSLNPNSPAIDKGVDIGLPFEGSAPDLGALELGMTLGQP